MTSEPKPNWLSQQIKSAQKSIRTMKKHTPWMFIEYNHMVQARINLRKAQEEYDKTCKAWQEFGEK